MPHMDSKMQDFGESKCFASLDFLSACWQLPVHTSTDPYIDCGVLTSTGVLASKRVLPGLANDTSYFQSTLETLFAELRGNMKAWVDDFDLNAKKGNEMIILLAKFFAICKEKRILLSARKSVLFAKNSIDVAASSIQMVTLWIPSTSNVLRIWKCQNSSRTGTVRILSSVDVTNHP